MFQGFLSVLIVKYCPKSNVVTFSLQTILHKTPFHRLEEVDILVI